MSSRGTWRRRPCDRSAGRGWHRGGVEGEGASVVGGGAVVSGARRRVQWSSLVRRLTWSSSESSTSSPEWWWSSTWSWSTWSWSCPRLSRCRSGGLGWRCAGGRGARRVVERRGGRHEVARRCGIDPAVGDTPGERRHQQGERAGCRRASDHRASSDVDRHGDHAGGQRLTAGELHAARSPAPPRRYVSGMR